MNLKQKVYKVRVELESGLHIGGGDTAIEIGGVDNKVIRDTVSNEPYIPGSSLKGKVRHLLENYYHADAEHTELIHVLFGLPGDKKATEEKYKQTRLQFVDLFMDLKTKEALNQSLGSRVYTVVKYENRINRNTGTAEDPRSMERVPRGSIFEGILIMNVFTNLQDDEPRFESVLKKGFELLNNSYLGGSGSRGYGKVKVDLQAV